jgi:hypothetical protein
MKDHVLRLKTRLLFAVRRHRIFVLARGLVLKRQPNSVDDMKREREQKAKLGDDQKRVRDERVAVEVVFFCAHHDEHVAQHVREDKQTPDEPCDPHDLFPADTGADISHDDSTTGRTRCPGDDTDFRSLINNSASLQLSS